jgi:site-specific DNA recombinase
MSTGDALEKPYQQSLPSFWKLIEMVMDGVPTAEVKDEMIANAARREELKARLAAADAPPPLLHAEMAGLYSQKVTALAQALEHSETRTEASEALRASSTPSS